MYKFNLFCFFVCLVGVLIGIIEFQSFWITFIDGILAIANLCAYYAGKTGRW